jgi:hypothetical protein
LNYEKLHFELFEHYFISGSRDFSYLQKHWRV